MRATRCCSGRHSIQRYTGPSNRGIDVSLLRNRWYYMCRRRYLPMPGRYVSSMIADLFEALGVIRAAAHAVEILRHDRVIGL